MRSEHGIEKCEISFAKAEHGRERRLSMTKNDDGAEKKTVIRKPFLKRIMIAIIILVFAMLSVAALWGAKREQGSASAQVITTPNVNYKVVFEVRDASGYASVAYLTDNDAWGIPQPSEVATPWVYTFNTSSGTFLYLWAQDDMLNGSVKVTIYTDDNVWKTSNNSGQSAPAVVFGQLPSKNQYKTDVK